MSKTTHSVSAHLNNPKCTFRVKVPDTNMHIQRISKKITVCVALRTNNIRLQCQDAKHSRSHETSPVSKCPHANATHQDRCLKNCFRKIANRDLDEFFGAKRAFQIGNINCFIWTMDDYKGILVIPNCESLLYRHII